MSASLSTQADVNDEIDLQTNAVEQAGVSEEQPRLDYPAYRSTMLRHPTEALQRGRVARDVLVLARPEVGELSEGSPGGSPTMPHKQNPVLATLVRSGALAVPALVSTLHLAAAEQVDERVDGAWHLEWPTLRDLARLSLVTVSQTADLLAGLRVHAARMSTTLSEANDAVLAEQRSLGGDPTAAATTYLGESRSIVDLVVARAHERTQPR